MVRSIDYQSTMRVLQVGEGCWVHELAETPSNDMVPCLLGEVVGVECGGFNVARPASCGEGGVVVRLTFNARVFASRAEALAAGACVSALAPQRHRTACLATLDEA